MIGGGDASAACSCSRSAAGGERHPAGRRAIDGFAQRSTIERRRPHFEVRLPLVGAFQVENALVAAGLAHRAPASEPTRVFAALDTLKGAKGRLELVGERNGAPIFVDYAHKPDALAKALEALRPYAERSSSWCSAAAATATAASGR